MTQQAPARGTGRPTCQQRLQRSSSCTAKHAASCGHTRISKPQHISAAVPPCQFSVTQPIVFAGKEVLPHVNLLQAALEGRYQREAGQTQRGTGCTVLFLAVAQVHRSPSASAAHTGAPCARMLPISAKQGVIAACQPSAADCTPSEHCSWSRPAGQQGICCSAGW